MSDRDIWLNFAEKAVTMHEGVKFVGIICNAEVWFVKDKAVGDFLRGPSALPIQAVSPAPPQARAELRDRFAMAALTGLLANPALLETMRELMNKNGDKFSEKYRNYTELADFHADAMMKARGHE